MFKKIIIWSIPVFLLSQLIYKASLTADMFELIGFLIGQYIFCLFITAIVIITRTKVQEFKNRKRSEFTKSNTEIQDYDSTQ
ncbi:MAG: hypothetical protein ACRCXZ_08250 [Patescibacteria group bacterium]